MKRPILKSIKPEILAYIEYLEACKDGSTDIANAINLVKSGYAKEFTEKANAGNLLNDPDFLEMYIKIGKLYFDKQPKNKSAPEEEETDTQKEKAEIEPKGSIFELTQQRMKQAGKI